LTPATKPKAAPATPPKRAPAAKVKPAASSVTAEPASPATPPQPRINRRKVREGVVVSSAMDKTAVVLVTERVRHSRYAKTVQRTKRLYAHDPTNDTKVGDRVQLMETRPMSKTKRWRLVQVVERAR